MCNRSVRGKRKRGDIRSQEKFFFCPSCKGSDESQTQRYILQILEILKLSCVSVIGHLCKCMRHMKSYLATKLALSDAELIDSADKLERTTLLFQVSFAISDRFTELYLNGKYRKLIDKDKIKYRGIP